MVGIARRRIVAGSRHEFELYRSNFPGDKVTDVSRLQLEDQLRGLSPASVQVILLPSWDRVACDNPRLDDALRFYKARWSTYGVERVKEEELQGGPPARARRLLAEYEEHITAASRNGLAWTVAHDWIKQLQPWDCDLLAAAFQAQKQGKNAKPQGEKSPEIPLRTL